MAPRLGPPGKGSGVRVALVGDERPAVRASLEAEEEVELIGPPGAFVVDGDGEIPQLAAALRAFESQFDEERVDRVVLADSSDLSLAAVLVATKMLIPVGALVDRGSDQGEGGPFGMNARLIELLADAALGDDGAAVAAWLREPQQPSQAAREH